MLKQHPLSAAFPEMPKSDYQALKDSVENIGVQNPITLFEGMVIDGWHRYRAAYELGVFCPFVELGDVDPQEFVLAQNKVRRHITQSQLALAASAVYQWMPEGRPVKNPAPGAAFKTVQEMAAAAGVSERTIRQAKTVHTNAAPEVVDAVKRGDIGLKKAAAISQLPKEQQAEALKKPIPKKVDHDAPITQEEVDAAMAEGLPTYEELLDENARLSEIVESIQSGDPEAEVVKQVGIANYYRKEYDRMKNAENGHIDQIKRQNRFIDDVRKLTGLDKGAPFAEIMRTLKQLTGKA